MQYKNIICKYCGNHAKVTTLRKVDYCNKEECRKKAHAEISRNNYIKTTKNKSSFVPLEKRVVSVEALDSTDFSDIKELSNILGDVRHRLIQLKEKIDYKEQKITQKDDYILHTIEFENMTDEQGLKFLKDMKRDRTERRGLKLKKEIVRSYLDSIMIKNPNQFLNDVLEGARKTRDVKQLINSLKSDTQIFVVAKGGNVDRATVKKG